MSMGKVSLKMRPNFSIRHIRSAAKFVKWSAEIEKDYLGRPKEFTADSRVEYEACVVGCIFILVAFLEATVNEVFADAEQNANHLLEHLDLNTVTAVAAHWKDQKKLRRLSTLEKYQLALELSHKTPLNPDQSPYENARLVVRLRNALIHYHPEWLAAGSDAEYMNDLGRSLYGKFPPDPFMTGGNPYFPDKCLNHGCAQWAIDSCLQFTDEFFSRMGVTPRYDSIRPLLAVS